MPDPNEIPSIPDFELPGMSEAFELVTLPLPLTLLQWAGIKLRDVMFESQLDAEFVDLKPKISEALAHVNAGYLIRLNVFVHEAGTLEIPGGNIVTDIGMGVEPSDALAESYRVDSMGAAAPRLAKNASSYVWIAKGRDGQLTVRHIPSAARQALEATATREAIRRNQLGTYYTVLPAKGFRHIAVAEYWSDAQARLKDAIVDARRQLDIAKKTQGLLELQRQANAVYLEHQQTMLELRNAQNREAALAQLMRFVDVFKGALQLGQICAADDRQIGGTAAPDPNGRLLVEYGQKIVELKDSNLRISKTWHTYVELMNKNVDELSGVYRDANAPVRVPDRLILD